MILWDTLTILAVLVVATAVITHPATDQTWLAYLWNSLKNLV